MINFVKIGALAFGLIAGISIGVGATMASNKVHTIEKEEKREMDIKEKIKVSWPYFIPGLGFMTAAEFCIFKNITTSEKVIKRLATSVKAGGELAKTTSEITKTIAGPKKKDQIDHDVYDTRVQKIVKEVQVPNTAVVYCATTWYGQTDDEFERSLYYTTIQDHQQNVNRVIGAAYKKYGDNPTAHEGMSIHDLYDGTSGKAISEDDMFVWPVLNGLPNWEPKYSGDKNGVPVYGLWLDTPPTDVRM